ncbi:MAG: hypothetical protein OHK005_08390 [Candidatus Methylacidiphilales bacterium]
MKNTLLLALTGIVLASPFTLTGHAAVGSLEKDARQEQCSGGGCGGKEKDKEKSKDTTAEKPKA